MFRRIVQFTAGLVLTALALTVVFAALEFVVFRYILLPDDVLRTVSIDKVVRYQPDSRAVLRHPDGSRTTVTINSQGWNSWRSFYEKQRPAGRLRVAVIGDSYVHGAFVDADQGFPAVVERQLRAKGYDAEVYSFGMAGAPLSQYLNVLRREVVAYKPDVVVIPLIHDDFDESYQARTSTETSSFMKLRRRPDGSIAEVTPIDFEPGLMDKLRTSATFRYLYDETGLHRRAERWVSRNLGLGDDWTSVFVTSATAMRTIRDHHADRRFAHYVLAEMKALATRHGFKLVVAMDAVREAIYAGKPPQDYEDWRLNHLAAKLTGEFELPFVDLHEIFRRDYQFYGRRLEFAYDRHWNRRGNRLAGRAIARLIEDQLAAPPGGARSAAANPVRSLAN